MSLRLGKVGVYETVCLTAVSLSMCGIFCFDSEAAYSNGNSTYLSIPAAIIISILCFLSACSAMKKCGAPDLLSLFRYSLGTVSEKIFTVLLTIVVLIDACILLNTFLNIMHSYFYVQGDYFTIACFLLPVVLYFAWSGFETLTRTAKVISFIVLFSHFFMLICSAPGFEVYKIYPIVGDGIQNTLKSSVEYSFLFLPLLLLLLCLSNGVNGVKYAKKSGIIASLVAFFVCTLTQLAIAFSYTYTDLSKMYSPLYRLSMVTGTENFVMRIDKATVFFWLAAALVAISYKVYGASYLYSKTFSARDVRPNVAIMCLITLTVSLAAHVGNSLVMYLFEFTAAYGFFVLFIPVVIASAVALVKSSVKKKVSCP